MAGDLEKQRRGASPAPQVTSPRVEPERPFPLRSWPPRSRSSPPPGALPAIPATMRSRVWGLDSFQEGQCLDGLGRPPHCPGNLMASSPPPLPPGADRNPRSLGAACEALHPPRAQWYSGPLARRSSATWKGISPSPTAEQHRPLLETCGPEARFASIPFRNRLIYLLCWFAIIFISI